MPFDLNFSSVDQGGKVVLQFLYLSYTERAFRVFEYLTPLYTSYSPRVRLLEFTILPAVNFNFDKKKHRHNMLKNEKATGTRPLSAMEHIACASVAGGMGTFVGFP